MIDVLVIGGGIEIESTISRYVENCTADDWPSPALKLSRIGGWEYEDYQP